MDWNAAFATHLGYPEILARLGTAAVIGLAVGIDRELRHHAHGLRTNMLVAIGAAVFGIIGTEMGARHALDPSGGTVRFDVAQVAHGVIVGVGFLGGGAIIRGRRGRHDVAGVTTAAAVWALAAAGLAAGYGLLGVALAAGAALVLVLTVLRVAAGGRPGNHASGAGEGSRRDDGR